MREHLFIDGWTFARDGDESHPIDLPHDAMLIEGRSPSAPAGAHGAHFLGGRYRYAKRWVADEGLEAQLFLRFEGVYGSAVVTLNGQEVARNVTGYREFVADVSAAVRGAENLIEVEVDNADQPNARWYTGSGIIRPIRLIERPADGFVHDSVRVRTLRVTDEAHLEVDYRLAAKRSEGERVVVELRDAETVVAAETRTASGEEPLAVVVPVPRLWSADDPHLYRLTIRLERDGTVIDEETHRIGIRTIEVDAAHGLRVNGHVVKLRGGCIHDDSGVLGAASFLAARRRQARILKAVGFNAIRSAHQPLSREMLQAADEVGLYVMDELTDVWDSPKTQFDGSRNFADTWRADADAMVGKAVNHPSVIMYSIGNEIGETAIETGIARSAELSEYIRSLDPSRPTTLGLNFFLNTLASFNVSVWKKHDEHADGPEHEARKAPAEAQKLPRVTSTLVNVISNAVKSAQPLIARTRRADRFSRDAFATVDIAGYNYGISRYRIDAKRYPERVMVGSETLPSSIVRSWRDVERFPAVIGDFQWTAWDYLGEAGLSSWSYDEPIGFGAPYPALTAGAGAVDLIGAPAVGSLLTRGAWHLLDAPEIAVQPLDLAGRKVYRSVWRHSDAVQSWSWRGHEGEIAEVEVYSNDDEVELLLNGRSLGRRTAGDRVDYLTRFRVPYEPGELTAISYRRGVEAARSTLRSAVGDLGLRLEADRTVLDASGLDLAFLTISVADARGVVESTAADAVTVEVSGAGQLVGSGSAAWRTPESYLDPLTTTERGRALAVVRAAGRAGEITVVATSARYGRAELTLTVAGE